MTPRVRPDPFHRVGAVIRMRTVHRKFGGGGGIHGQKNSPAVRRLREQIRNQILPRGRNHRNGSVFYPIELSAQTVKSHFSKEM